MGLSHERCGHYVQMMVPVGVGHLVSAVRRDQLCVARINGLASVAGIE